VNHTRANQLGSLLYPDVSVPDPDPRCPYRSIGVVGNAVVQRSPDDERVAIGGERHCCSLSSGRDGARADEFGPLLRPDSFVSDPDPHGAGAGRVVRRVIAGTSHDGSIAIGGDRHRGALMSEPARSGARANQFGALLDPASSPPDPDPCGPVATVCRGFLRRWRCFLLPRPRRSPAERFPQSPMPAAWVPAGRTERRWGAGSALRREGGLATVTPFEPCDTRSSARSSSPMTVYAVTP
jgi:hypothetical protein